MQRIAFVLIAVAALASLDAPRALAAQELPNFPEYPGLSQQTVQQFQVGPGFYLSWIKILLAWVLFVLWVHTVDWISRDGQQLKLDYRRWNLAVFFSFMLGVIVLWVAPIFWIGFAIMFLAWFVSLIVYVKYRNSKVTVDETVFTPGHIRYWLSQKLAVVGIKIAAEARRGRGNAPPVELQSRGAADEVTNNANLLLARQSPGYELTQSLVAELIARRADAVMLNFSQESVAFRYQIDGVWHDAEPRDRPTGDTLLAVMKKICNLNPDQRVARQHGEFGAAYEKAKYTCKLTSQGTPTGERALVQLLGTKPKGTRLPELDMRQKTFDDLKAVLEAPGGLVVVSAPPAGGLTTLLNATVGSMDRYVRGFVCIEAADKREVEIENVPVTTFSPQEGPTQPLVKLLREHPDVLVAPDLVDAETATTLCEQATEQRRTVVTSVRAKEASEAVLRLMMLKMPPAKFIPAISASLNQRLIRVLCDQCKEAYPPPPQVLQQLGIPAGRVEAFYRPPEQPEKVCPQCAGIGYIGRTALFELLIVDDGVRAALSQAPQLNTVRQAARKAGMRTLQEEGIVLVAKGVTSLQELMRVMKE